MASYVSLPVRSLLFLHNDDTRVRLLCGRLHQRHRYIALSPLSCQRSRLTCVYARSREKGYQGIQGHRRRFSGVPTRGHRAQGSERHTASPGEDETTEDSVTHINAIRGMALVCQLPLRDFTVKLKNYESTLGPFTRDRFGRW